MRRTLVPFLAAALLVLGMPLAAAADTSPSPSPSPTATPTPTPSPTPAPTPTQTPAPTPAATSSSTEPSPDPSQSPPSGTVVSPSPSPSDTSTPVTTPTPTPQPTPVPTLDTSAQDNAARLVVEQTRQEIGSGLADALAVQQQLTDALATNASQQDIVQRRIDESQTRLDQLDMQIQQLNDRIEDTQQRIESERTEVAVLARALYQEPSSLLVRLLQAGNLRELVTQAGDLTAAALRADALKQRLADDLDRLNSDQAQRQRARDDESQVATQLSDSLMQLEELSTEEASISEQLQGLIDDSQAALSNGGASLALLQRIAALLRSQQLTLIATAEQAVWRQAALWAQLNKGLIPVPGAETAASRPPGSSLFVWPERGATITQGFGPTALWLEPPLFGFTHFHTGVDLAGGNKTIVAAGDGVVAVVGSGTTGYGNYVIIVHAGGIATLYGHLSVAAVKAGDRVAQGQPIGIEGSTGASTGPHLHFEVRVDNQPVDPMPFLPSGANA